MKSMNIEQSQENVKAVLVLMKSVKGFKIGDPVAGMVKAMALAITNGNNDEAVKKGGEIVSVGRTILGAFIRNSAIDHMKGEVATTAFFNRQIAHLRDDEGFDKDIIDGLVARHGELVEAVRQETAGDFTKRVTAYNAMSDALKAAEVEQTRRDTVRRTLELAGKASKKKGADKTTTDANRRSLNAQREKVLQQRKDAAEDLLGLL